MGLLRVDESKCKSDGICARECPISLIQLAEGSGFPEIIQVGEGICIECGHCVAVCPHGALTHERIPMERSPAIMEELRINEEQAVQFLRSRRSIRRYQDKPVEKEKCRRLIEVARYAPTGANSQSVEWLVLSDKSKIKVIGSLAIDWLRQFVEDPFIAETPIGRGLRMLVSRWDEGYDSVFRNAPVLLIASAPREDLNGMVDVTLALSYLDLLAPTMGLGTCWAGVLQGALLASPSLKSVVGIPENHPHHYPMMLGYPDVKYHRLPERKPPRIAFT